MNAEVRTSKSDNSNDRAVDLFIKEHLDLADPPEEYVDDYEVNWRKEQIDLGLVLECVDKDQYNKLLGVATLSLLRNDDSIMLEELVVLEEFRRQGIGKKLVLAAMRLAQKQGATILDVNSTIEAVGFYQKLEFELLEPIQEDYTRMQIKL